MHFSFHFSFADVPNYNNTKFFGDGNRQITEDARPPLYRTSFSSSGGGQGVLIGGWLFPKERRRATCAIIKLELPLSPEARP